MTKSLFKSYRKSIGMALTIFALALTFLITACGARDNSPASKGGQTDINTTPTTSQVTNTTQTTIQTIDNETPVIQDASQNIDDDQNTIDSIMGNASDTEDQP
jgi:uncharacterized lipoprotein YehR (DUF1307 family)